MREILLLETKESSKSSLRIIMIVLHKNLYKLGIKKSILLKVKNIYIDGFEQKYAMSQPISYDHCI